MAESRPSGRSGWPRCPNCQQTNLPDARTCARCGERLEPGVAQKEERHATDRPRLVGRTGLLKDQEFEIGARGLAIGRSLSNQMVIPDAEISRHHARIELSPDGRTVLKDMESGNGTYVDGQRITSRELADGDRVTFGTSGEQSFQFFEGSAQIALRPAATRPSIAATQAIPEDALEEHPSVAATQAISADALEDRPSVGATQAFHAEEMEEQLSAHAVKAAMPAKPRSTGRPQTTMALPQDISEQVDQRTPLHLVIDRHTVRPMGVPEEGLVIGRDPERSPLARDFNHPSISGEHAEFRWQGSILVLHDLDSRNGTYVNGKRIQKHALEEADFIRFGNYDARTILYRSGTPRVLSVSDLPIQGDLCRIGRGPGNEIRLDHPAVSRLHAEIHRKGGQFTIHDATSNNGVFINGVRERQKVLRAGDIITIGPFHLRFDGQGLEQRSDGTGVRLELYRVNKRVGEAKIGKKVLDDITMEIAPRRFVGLLGPSGCGKTSLLDAISGFRPASDGTVLANHMDMRRYAQSFRSTIGYVPQEDIVHRQLTVEECLRYAAGLRLPSDTTRQEVDARVEEVIQEIGLAERRSMPITLLSGGQRKRVSIGIEILSKPSILFLDEPTAGLDPHTEVQIMQLFRELANQGATLLTTTHVLGSFSLFDHVVIMVAGKLAFVGPPDQMLQYFGVESPYEIYGRLIEEKKPEEWKAQFERTETHQQVSKKLKEVGKAAPPEKPAGTKAAKRKSHEGWHQWRLLCSRYLRLKTKDKTQVAFLLLQAPLIGVLVSFLSPMPNAPGTLFMVMFAALWFGCSNAVREISDELSIYRRERQTGLVIPAYLMSKLTVLGVIGALQSFLLVSVLTGMSVFPQFGGLEGNYLLALLVTFLINLNGTLIGLFLSSMFSSSEKALAWFPLVLIPELLLAGLFVPVQNIERLIPLTNQQLAEQVIARTKAEVPPTLAQWMIESGFGQRVRGVLALDDKAAASIGEFLGGTTEGMGPALRWLSAACISRWGLESLSDLYLHDEHARQSYSFQLINTVAITLHPRDAQLLRSQAAEVTDAPVVEPSPLGPHMDYLAILMGFSLVMTVLVGLVLKSKDGPGA